MALAPKFKSAEPHRPAAANENMLFEGVRLVYQYARLAGVKPAQALDYVQHGKAFPDKIQQQAFCEVMMVRGSSVEILRFNHPELRALEGSQLLH